MHNFLTLSHLVYADSGNVRLVNGNNPCSGRVEILHDGQWRTVCDDYWDINEATVVCRELDCGNVIKITSRAYFGEGSGPISQAGDSCVGSETTLNYCITNWNVNNCDHEEDSGVVCSGMLPQTSSCYYQLSLSFIILTNSQ